MEWDLYLFLKCAGIAVFVFAGGASVSKALGISRSKAYLINSAAVFVALAGSRTWFIVQHYFGSEPYVVENLWDAWDNAGSVLYGWILGGTFALIILTKHLKLNTTKYLDCVLTWLLVAQFLNRMGCFDAGCCYGKETGWGAPVFGGLVPVQLYESIFDLLLFWFIRTRPKQLGLPTFLYFVGYPTGRFFFEFLRGDNMPAAFGLTVPQITSVILVAFALIKLRPAPLPKQPQKTIKK